MAVTLDFQGKILKLMYLRNGRVDSLGMKRMWVGCSMGLTLDHGAWQIERPSNGSMWNSYSFQPVGQWMGYLFTDLEAEGCCHSLNALLPSVGGGIKDVDPSPELLLQSLWMAWNCWCILTTLKTDYILVIICWFSSFWRHLDLVKQAKFVISVHFLVNTREEWPQIWHVDVFWSPSEQLDFGHGLLIFLILGFPGFSLEHLRGIA